MFLKKVFNDGKETFENISFDEATKIKKDELIFADNEDEDRYDEYFENLEEEKEEEIDDIEEEIEDIEKEIDDLSDDWKILTKKMAITNTKKKFSAKRKRGC